MTRWMLVNAVAIAAVCIWLVRQAYPPVRAVRVRNALLLRCGSMRDFTWSPSDVPAGFQLEKRPPSPEFAAAVQRLHLDRAAGDWERAVKLASHLTEAAKDLGPIRADLHTTYRKLLEGYGYCADFVKVFLALAHSAGLFVRQWAFSFDGFGGHGHTVVEVFDRGRGRWQLLDVHNNFHFVDAKTRVPLSALELRDCLSDPGRTAQVVPNGPGRPGYKYPEKALEYYRAGLDQWYLMWGNAVFTYDAHPLVRLANRVSGGLGQFAATLLGVHPEIRILPTSSNAALRAGLCALRTQLRWMVLAAVVLVLLLGAQVLAGAIGPNVGGAP